MNTNIWPFRPFSMFKTWNAQDIDVLFGSSDCLRRLESSPSLEEHYDSNLQKGLCVKAKQHDKSNGQPESPQLKSSGSFEGTLKSDNNFKCKEVGLKFMMADNKNDCEIASLSFEAEHAKRLKMLNFVACDHGQ